MTDDLRQAARQYGRFLAAGAAVGVASLVFFELLRRAFAVESIAGHAALVSLTYLAGALLSYKLQQSFVFARRIGPHVMPFVVFFAISAGVALAAGPVSAALLAWLPMRLWLGEQAPAASLLAGALIVSPLSFGLTRTFFHAGLQRRLSDPRAADAAFVVAAIVACLLWTVHAGKDLNWDAWNYHLYAPLNLVQDRLQQDFMAASIQSYFNPVAYLPLYAMVKAQWHSLAIASALALMHACALILLYLTAKTPAFLPSTQGRGDAWLGTMLGAATLPFWNAVGSSFADLTTAVPVLGAIWLYCSRPLATRPAQQAFAIGLLLGLAAALKLTNAVYVVAGILLPLLAPRLTPNSTLRVLAAYAGGAALGGVAAGGAWAWRLWQEFANPVFPLYNAVFRSQDFPAVNFFHARFIPGGLGEALTAPFRMGLPEVRLYSELISPDIRIPLLMALGAALAVRPAMRFLRREPPMQRRDGSILPAITAFWAAAFALWMATSFNARYGIVLLMLAGPLLVAAYRALVGPRCLVMACAAALLLQVGALVLAGAERWTPLPWTRQWMEIEVPQPLRESPNLYLSIDLQPAAVLALYVHPDSGFINVRGQHALDLDGPGGERVQRLLKKYDGRLRSLNLNHELVQMDAGWVDVVNGMYGRFGLRIDAKDCAYFRFDQRTYDPWSHAANRLVGFTKRLNEYPFFSCRLHRAPVREDYIHQRPRIDAIFNAIEQACPRLFTPGLSRSEQIGASWSRFYSTTDRALVIEDGYVFGRQSMLEWLVFGRIADWEDGKRTPSLPRDCATRTAQLLPD